MPQRIQRRRSKGWRMPLGAVYVGRPTIYGNPFTPSQYYDAGYSSPLAVATKECVDAFRAFMLGQTHWAHGCNGHGYPPPLDPLRGKDLACWCRLDQPCHADVLLDLANRA